MMNKPYIGITGFMSRREVRTVLNSWPADTNYKLMVGVLVSKRTCEGESGKFPARYPNVMDDVAGIFIDDTRCLNLIHYSTNESSTLDMQLMRLIHRIGHSFDGFQLNIAWPDPMFLELVKQRFPKIKFVLQIGGKAVKDMDYDAARIAEKIWRDYRERIDYALIDLSGGKGEELPLFFAADCVRAISRRTQGRVMVGVAGGLSDTNTEVLKRLAIHATYGLSVDAESRLRNKVDDLDLDKAVRYVSRAHTVLEG